MQRKPTQQSRGPNTAEKRFMTWVKAQPCAACMAPGPSIVHHAEGATWRNNKVLAGHWFLLSLCRLCDDVITQGSRRRFRLQFGPQSALWAVLMLRYQHETGDTVPEEVKRAILEWGR